MEQQGVTWYSPCRQMWFRVPASRLLWSAIYVAEVAIPSGSTKIPRCMKFAPNPRSAPRLGIVFRTPPSSTHTLVRLLLVVWLRTIYVRQRSFDMPQCQQPYHTRRVSPHNGVAGVRVAQSLFPGGPEEHSAFRYSPGQRACTLSTRAQPSRPRCRFPGFVSPQVPSVRSTLCGSSHSTGPLPHQSTSPSSSESMPA